MLDGGTGDDVRGIRGGPAVCAAAAGTLGDRDDRRGPRDPAAVPAAVADGRVHDINYGRMAMLHASTPTPRSPRSSPTTIRACAQQLAPAAHPLGPLFTLLTYAVVPLGLAGSLWAFKAMLMALQPRDDPAGVAVARACSAATPVAAIVLVCLNPLILVWGLGGDHNDFLMMFLHHARLLPPVAGGCPGHLPRAAIPADLVRAGFHARCPRGSSGCAGRWQSMARRASLPEPRVRWARVRAWRWPLAAPESGAGVALAAAIALKASAAILVPVILVALSELRGGLVQVALGLIAGGNCAGGVHGGRVRDASPDLGAQGHLVIPMACPTCSASHWVRVGSETMRSLLSVVLVLTVVGCS